MSDPCVHLDTVADVVPSSDGCEDWWWCYPEERLFEVEGAPPAPSHP